jgi:hypothetical protein
MGNREDELRIPGRELEGEMQAAGSHYPSFLHLIRKFYQIIRNTLSGRQPSRHLCGSNQCSLIISIVMKKQHTRKSWLVLQGLVLTGVAVFALHALLSFKALNRYADLWDQLGTSKQSGTNSIKESFLNGYFYYSGRNIKHILSGDRAAIAKDLLNYSKEYVNSEEFAKAYERHRLGNKPMEPAPAIAGDSIRRKFINDIKKGIESTEKFMKTSNDAEMKKTMQESLTMLQATLKDYEDPNSQTIKIAIEGEQYNYEFRMKGYKTALKAWEEKFPVNVKPMIKVRLQQLLTLTKDVDFNAQLTDRFGKKVFVNKDFERKPTEWKMAFRAGKEVTTTVQAFARQWLQELQ